jgi:hypothetical protein
MKTLTMVKMGLGTGAAILVLSAAPAANASSTGVNVPCSGPAGGSAGLIAAINRANSSGGGAIYLARECTYALTTADNTNPNPMIGANGLPVVISRITMNGFRTTIAGNDSDFRILEVNGPGNLTIQGVTITGGNVRGFGGGIFNDEGTLTLDHSRVTGNTGGGGGGGGGGIASGTNGTGPLGTTTLNFSQVDANTSTGSAGGILNHAGTLTLNHSQVTGNTAAVGGGGIASGTGGNGGVGASTLTLNFSQVDNNTANGGPLTGAGGIANGGTATINASQVNGNTAPGSVGAGILNHGVMSIDLSQVNGNTAPTDGSGDTGVGGGIANLDISLLTGTANSAVLTVNLSQVDNNSASGIGGGILEDGIYPDDSFGAPSGPLTLRLSQVTGNAAGEGGGIYASGGSAMTLTLAHVVKNTPDNCFPLGGITGCEN